MGTGPTRDPPPHPSVHPSALAMTGCILLQLVLHLSGCRGLPCSRGEVGKGPCHPVSKPAEPGLCSRTWEAQARQGWGCGILGQIRHLWWPDVAGLCHFLAFPRILFPTQTQPALEGKRIQNRGIDTSGLKVLDDIVETVKMLLGTIGSLQKYFPMV